MTCRVVEYCGNIKCHDIAVPCPVQDNTEGKYRKALGALRTKLGPEAVEVTCFAFDLGDDRQVELFCLLVQSEKHRLQILHQAVTLGTQHALYAVATMGGSKNMLFVAYVHIPRVVLTSYAQYIGKLWGNCGPFKQFEVPQWLSDRLSDERVDELTGALKFVDLSQGFEDYHYGVDPLTMMTHMVLAAKLLISVYHKEKLFVLKSLLALVNAWYNFLKSGVDNRKSQVAIPTDRVFRRNTPGFALVLMLTKHQLMNAKGCAQVLLWCHHNGCRTLADVKDVLNGLSSFAEWWAAAKRDFSMGAFFREVSIKQLIVYTVLGMRSKVVVASVADAEEAKGGGR